MTIEEFHTNIRSYLNPGQGRYFTPEQIDSAINSSILDHFKDDYKHFEETQEITDTLGFFKKDAEKTVSAGVIQLPDDYFHITDLEAVMSNGERYCLILIKDASWTIRKNSMGFGPDATHPLGRQIAAKIQVLPVATNSVVGVVKVNVSYLRKPAVAKFNYTEISGYGFEYVDSGSVQVDWPAIDSNRIMLKALGYLGIPIQNTISIQAEQIKKASGV